jgi:hypothetical protein
VEDAEEPEPHATPVEPPRRRYADPDDPNDPALWRRPGRRRWLDELF